ncbi:MAG: metallophosphoesterase [Spirochaetaceae bacterium]
MSGGAESKAEIQRDGLLARISPGEDGRLLVFGDIHGDLAALKRGLSLRRPGDIVVFLGDYADRGAEGVEVIEGINALLDAHPDKVAALKGNHEEYTEDGEPTFRPCTLIEEANRKRGGWEKFFDSTFKGFMNKLSIAAIAGGTLFVHGGIGKGIEDPSSLEEPDQKLRQDILWSDPGPEKGISPNMRGAGTVFGPDVTDRILEALGCRLIIRSHEPRKAVNGPAFDHDGRVVTLNSTRVYGGRPFLLSLSAENLGSGEEACVSRDSIEESTLFLDKQV